MAQRHLPLPEHLAKHGHKPLALSLPLLRYWHSRLNYLLFRGKLGRINITYGDSPGEVCGLYYPDQYEPRIHIDTRCHTRQAILDTLAHEMVHQHQHKLGVPLTHGRLFKAFAKKAAKHGLTL
jgi:hypothetical protein